MHTMEQETSFFCSATIFFALFVFLFLSCTHYCFAAHSWYLNTSADTDSIASSVPFDSTLCCSCCVQACDQLIQLKLYPNFSFNVNIALSTCFSRILFRTVYVCSRILFRVFLLFRCVSLLVQGYHFSEKIKFNVHHAV